MVWVQLEAAAEKELDGDKWSVAYVPLQVTRLSIDWARFNVPPNTL